MINSNLFYVEKVLYTIMPQSYGCDDGWIYYKSKVMWESNPMSKKKADELREILKDNDVLTYGYEKYQYNIYQYCE